MGYPIINANHRTLKGNVSEVFWSKRGRVIWLRACQNERLASYVDVLWLAKGQTVEMLCLSHLLLLPVFHKPINRTQFFFVAKTSAVDINLWSLGLK